MVRTVKSANASLNSVQQAQYVNDWSFAAPARKTESAPFKKTLEGTPLFKPAQTLYRRLFYNADNTLRRSRQLRKVPIQSVI